MKQLLRNPFKNLKNHWTRDQVRFQEEMNWKKGKFVSRNAIKAANNTELIQSGSRNECKTHFEDRYCEPSLFRATKRRSLLREHRYYVVSVLFSSFQVSSG